MLNPTGPPPVADAPLVIVTHGPFDTADTEFAACWAPREDDPDATAYIERLRTEVRR